VRRRADALDSRIVGAFRKDGMRVRTKRTWLLVAGLAVLCFGFIPAAGLVFSGVLGFLAALVIYCGTAFALLHAWNRWWRERTGRVVARAEGLWLDDAQVVARSAVRYGHLIHRDGAAFVRLGRTLRLVDVAVADDDEGNDLLTAMRLDAGRSVGQYPMNHGTYASAWIRAGVFVALCLVTAVGIVASGADSAVVWPALLGGAVAAFLWGANDLVRVSVGADGVRVRRLLSRSRFVPFGALEGAQTDGRNVTLRVRDGSVVQMHHPAGKGWKPLLFRDRADEARMLVERVEARAAEHRRAGGDVAGLARGNRETGAWLREVELASDDHASFRAPAVPPEALWRVVDDPAAATTARAGAAIALRNGLDEHGRARLRALADACAAPKLRVALQIVASAAEPVAIEDAFEELRDDEPRAGSRLPS
jgi:hypothetical protein